ncbi:hypothetical protein PTSG_10682 [Salpingoeca rosetta]|uniref:Btz domain-containing protein n=1 Tax=Salpingoeca rosetta (strain ATCC 50818 / BSB-021) TaxID=946362 RepID=F2UQ29_SALR5|nr:uncharacterized protein PTSG_10682 [Salpingoeca rosetta]EGD79697.1 hypothetical protein PTSG_10682 [Salpingoeca rosetta]|eukprot:XP_004988647.1 hypothetical protein PTSG_10682 [Salpingoeca rosetta]
MDEEEEERRLRRHREHDRRSRSRSRSRSPGRAGRGSKGWRDHDRDRSDDGEDEEDDDRHRRHHHRPKRCGGKFEYGERRMLKASHRRHEDHVSSYRHDYRHDRGRIGRFNRDRAAEDRIGGRPWGASAPARHISSSSPHRTKPERSRDPQSVPRRGYFFEHDDRGVDTRQHRDEKPVRGDERDVRHRHHHHDHHRHHDRREHRRHRRGDEPEERWTHDKFEEQTQLSEDDDTKEGKKTTRSSKDDGARHADVE